MQIKGRTMAHHDQRYFFGYGSLVNRNTHQYDNPRPAQLSGWRRVWRHTVLRPLAYLTVEPDSSTTIDGLIAAVPDADWDALDVRETAYERVPAAHQVQHPLPFQPEIALYSIPDGKHGRPTERHPVLLSYIDVVVQGYLHEYGAKGATLFFDTTDGWDAPILNDRAKPVYPRHCKLSRGETDFVDDALSRLSAQVKQL